MGTELDADERHAVRPRILVAEPQDFSRTAETILRQAGDLEMRPIPPGELRQALRDFDVVWFRLAHHINREILQGGVRCRLVATPVTGLDHVDLDACASSGVRVLSLRGETEFLKGIRATAELTLGLTLALLRRLPHAASSANSGAWDRDRFRGTELYSKTAGIVGVGRLGTIVAGYLRALGMDVVGYDPRPDFPEGVARITALDEVLSRADILSLHVSYDASTRHLLGRRELGLMKPSSVLVNTSRGGVIDEVALLDALESGRLAGAALDVIDGEPWIGPDHPLVSYARTHDNLVLVPHIGGNTRESFEKTEVFLAGRVAEALRGYPAVAGVL